MTEQELKEHDLTCIRNEWAELKNIIDGFMMNDAEEIREALGEEGRRDISETLFSLEDYVNTL